MNNPNQNHEPAAIDDHPDRLLDLALSELVGRTAPPDLSSRIAAATFRQPAAITQEPGTRQDRAFWLHLAVAVMLLIGVTIVLLPPFRAAREKSSHVAQLSGGLKNHHDTSRPFPKATTAPLATAQGQNRSIIASEGYRYLSNPSTPITTPSWNLELSKAQRVPETSAMTANWGAGPEGGPRTKDLYGSLDLSGPAAQPAEVNLGLNSTGANAGSGRLLVAEGRFDAPYDKTLAPQAGSEFGDQHGADAAKLVDSEVPGFSTVASDDVRALRGYGWSESRTTQLVDEIRELQRQGRPTEKLITELQRRNERSVDLSTLTAKGINPDSSGDKYTRIVENPFIKAEGGAAVSTFSIDVDTASYANVRQFLLQMNQLPPPDAVRIEELINYFHYDYAGPKATDEAPFAAHVEVTACPWAPEHRLARIGIKGREMDRNKRPQSNLVFLVDVSGSMNEPAKLPLVVYGLEQLTRELGENDHIGIVVYAGTEGLVLPSTSGSKRDTILAALGKLQAGGSTAGGAGIQLAYQIAEDNFIKGGTNRVILCTDGDFNVGVTNTADLQRMVEKKAKDTGVFLSTLGFGRGNLNDAMMLAISDHGNGNYHYIDNRTEARRVLVEEMTGTLVTIAKDVKIQVEFNPAQVAGYRLIGYEKRALRTEDFNDDKKDAGEIGAGHTVTALYEIIPVGKKVDVGPVDELKYQKPTGTTAEHADKPAPAMTKELLTLKMRYKAADGDTSKKLEWPVADDGKSFSAASGDLKFAASVAGFGMLLRNSQYKGNLTYAAAIELAQGGIGEDPHGYRKEFLDMVRKAKELRRE